MNCYSRDGILNVVISGAPTFFFFFFSHFNLPKRAVSLN